MFRRQRAAILERDEALKRFALDRLSEDWTPEQISGCLKRGTEKGLHPISTEANKALAVARIEDVLMGKARAKITDYISAESYAYHNPMIVDGLDAIIAAVEELTAQGEMFVYTEIHAVLGGGNFVLTVSEGEWSGQTHAFYDLLRMEGGVLVEHWDLIQPVPTEGLANAYGMFTGFEGVARSSVGQ